MAETVLDMIVKDLAPKLNKQIAPCNTKNIAISGGDLGGSHNLKAFLYQQTKKGVELGLTEQQAAYIAQQYGSNADTLLAYMENNDTALPLWLYAQLCYSIQHEMVTHPNDFMIRRTGYMFFNIALVRQYKGEILQEMATQLGWTDEQRARYEEQLEQEIIRATTAK